MADSVTPLTLSFCVLVVPVVGTSQAYVNLLLSDCSALARRSSAVTPTPQDVRAAHGGTGKSGATPVSPADAQGWGVPPAFVKMPYWRSFVISSEKLEKFGIGIWRSYYKISLRLNPISEQFFCLFDNFHERFQSPTLQMNFFSLFFLLKVVQILGLYTSNPLNNQSQSLMGSS